MDEKYSPRYRKKRKKSSASPFLMGLVLVMTALVAFSLLLRMLLRPAKTVPNPPDVQIAETVPEPAALGTPTDIGTEKTGSGFSKFWNSIFGPKQTEPTEPPIPEHVISEACIAVTGDILMHLPVINTGLQEDGGYNFDSIFQYLQPYASGADYAVANLETTLAGTEGGYQYSGYPAFNCPDEIVDSMKLAGFDLLLTANNHCYDTSEYGFLRTVRTVRHLGMTVLGTRAADTEPKFLVQEISGIRVGMVCYTYEGRPEKPKDGVVYMNWNALSATCGPLVNSFLAENLDPFYLEMRQCMEEMKQAGADVTIAFLHWGEEYQTAPNGTQRSMAQQLCDLGFDVIVGGHPHVIQPVELLSSRIDPDRKTVCLYSTGNAVSNQRIAEMNLKTGHTEDGLLFTATFAKYSDDTVYLQDVELLPCWVDMTNVTGRKEYHILPLDDATRGEWQTLYNLSDATLENAKKSYDRTMTLTGTGMAQSRNFLAAQKQQREAAYLAAVSPMADAA